MKELSIEEKAKAYDEALERARNWKEKSGMPKDRQGILDDIFPELKESEDERIRKELLEHCKNQAKPYIQTGNKCPQIQSWIAWLEKQGEQKPVDKVESKFKVGDWLIYKRPSNNPDICVVTEITDELCKNHSVNSDEIRNNSIEFVRCNYRLWTIQDAKSGDVIYLPNDNNEYHLFIFKGIENAAVMSFAHFYQYDDGTSEVEGTIDNLSSVNDVFQPATKEQRDLLFQKMSEAGYEWDAEKKELKKSQRMISAEAKEVLYDKPAWSEEDEKMYNVVHDLAWESYKKSSRLDIPTFGIINDWLKSLKERIGE